MRSKLVYVATGTLCILLLTEIFFLGYIIGINTIFLSIGYILTIILVLIGLMGSMKNRKKNLPIVSPILESEQLLYVKRQLNMLIKIIIPYNQKQKNRMSTFMNFKYKIENNVPLTENDIQELNKILLIKFKDY